MNDDEFKEHDVGYGSLRASLSRQDVALGRQDERLKALQRGQERQDAVLQEFISEVRSNYVRLERYIRVEIAVFGLIGIVLTTLLGFAIMKLVSQ